LAESINQAEPIAQEKPTVQAETATQEPKVDLEPKTEPQNAVPAQNNLLPTVEIVASTPSVEIATPSVEKSNVPIEKAEPKPIENTSPQLSPQPDPKPQELKGELKLRDINSLKTVLEEVYELWRINLMEKLAADSTKAHLEEGAKKLMQRVLFENVLNELTDNVNLNSLEMVYNRMRGVLESRNFPMIKMISKEHFCYERTD
jgi:hypothetical protein